MSNNYSNKSNKFARFMRNNIALLLIVFCIIAITTVVLVVTLSETPPPIDDPVNNKPDPTPDPDPDPVYETVKIYFQAPVVSSGTGMIFTDGVEVLFVYNSTIGTWKTHKGIDYLAENGAAVSAMYDGTVITVGSTFGDGNFVVIDHGNGVVVTYASLDDISVVKGQVVEKGDRIGAASTTASYSHKQGSHVHIEVEVNGVKVDPTPYVDGEVFFEVQRLVEA